MKNLKNYFCLAAIIFTVCFTLTGCGNNDNGSTSGNNDNNAVNDIANDAGNAVEDVADGVGDAVNDLVGNGGFNNYNDAHDYFLDTMGAYHSDAKFELRDEDKELNDYQEGSKGYHFSLYDTSKNDKGDLFGEFYVDATSGAIYKKGDNDTVTEYPTSNNGNKANNNGTANNNNAANGNNATNGNNTTSGNSTVGKNSANNTSK